MATEIRRAASVMPEGLRALEAEARSCGIRNVTVLINLWVSGSERYDAAGESLLLATEPGLDRVVGVGGLSQCRDVPGALRVRRFYVAAQWRRRGIASALARELIAGGLQHTNVLTCNASASAAAKFFWEAMGFEPADVVGITHRLTRS